MTGALTFPYVGWRIEPGDPTVGIFGDELIHEACTKEYDEGVVKGYVSGTYSGEGANRVIRETHLVSCRDCGVNALMIFESPHPDIPNDDLKEEV